MPALDQARILHGVVTMVGTTTMLRERTTHQLRDLAHLFRVQYRDHHITIQITDHGRHSPTEPSISEGDS
jgi:hypothetical protein